jgi:hypothetical protein
VGNFVFADPFHDAFFHVPALFGVSEGMVAGVVDWASWSVAGVYFVNEF